jgi:hypothetical protein
MSRSCCKDSSAALEFRLRCQQHEKEPPMPALAVVKSVDRPLSGLRAELRRATEQLSAASRALEEAQKPEQRLSAVVAELSAIEGELERLRSADASVLAEWLASGGDGARPEPSAATLGCERRLIGLRRDGDAARQALPVVTERAQRAGDAVARLHLARQRALWASAVDEAERYATAVWYPVLVEGLRVSAPLHSLRDELQAIGHRGDQAALGAAMRVDEIIRDTRASAAAPGDPAAGACLLRDLTDDSTATLGATAP